VLALEVDRGLIERLCVAFPAIDVVPADARTWDWSALARPPGGRVLVIGNLPYSVGTTILMALARAPHAIDAMALMLQREVAERVAAAPGGKAYGSLSVHVQLRWRVELALRVPPGAFRPPPKVESAVLRLAPLFAPRVMLADEARFEVIVRAAFAQRRKTLANALAAGLGVSVATAREAASGAGVDPGRRAETLNIEEFAEVARRL
jgi:16S rRNA (adenine1518-N6/adenine1519-N6)-dimethyltransferase